MNNLTMHRNLTTGLIASGVLVVVTLLVFFQMSRTGPVATIRLFHVALEENNEALLSRLTDRDANEPAFDALATYVRKLSSPGMQVSTVESMPQGNHIIMQVAYSGGNLKSSMIFVLDREGRNFRINCLSSIKAFQRALGLAGTR